VNIASAYLKESLLLLLLIVAVEVHSQESIILGVGPTLELEEELVGINARAYYGVNENICFGPEVSFFPYQEIGEEEEKSILDLNVNAHYIFEIGEKLGLYPLSGINYTIESERLIEEPEIDNEEEAIGINYGAGIHYNLYKEAFIFAEFKGIIGQLNAQFITAGFIIDLPFKKEKE